MLPYALLDFLIFYFWLERKHKILFVSFEKRMSILKLDSDPSFYLDEVLSLVFLFDNLTFKLQSRSFVLFRPKQSLSLILLLCVVVVVVDISSSDIREQLDLSINTIFLVPQIFFLRNDQKNL